MHEFSVASQIVRSVLEEAEKRESKKVLSVYIIIGDLTLLRPEQIRFSYKALVKGTLMEGSKLLIRRRKGRVICDECGYDGNVNLKDDPVYHISFPTLSCPQCGYPVRIVEGKECLIKSVKLVV